MAHKFYRLEREHPHHSQTGTRIDFSKEDFSTIMSVLRLPAATLEIICSNMFHFQQHTIALDARGLPVLGKVEANELLSACLI